MYFFYIYSKQSIQIKFYLSTICKKSDLTFTMKRLKNRSDKILWW